MTTIRALWKLLLAGALAVAAVRETFEETGLMLGVRSPTPVATPPGAWKAFAKAGILPDLSTVHFIESARICIASALMRRLLPKRKISARAMRAAIQNRQTKIRPVKT